MTTITRRGLLIGGAAVAAAGALGVTNATASPFTGTDTATASGGTGRPLPSPSRTVIRQWARDTWASLVAMTDERTGLTADNIDGPVRNPNRSGYTSPTNIGGYLWSAIVARDLGLISRSECSRRIGQTLQTLSTMARHQPSGMFYNWYDEANGAVLTTWPTDGSTVYPFLSSVDNGWLAAALMVVQNADRPNARLAGQLVDRMNFAAFYNPDAKGDLQVGLLRGGFWDGEKPADQTSAVRGNYLGDDPKAGPDVWYTGFHYDTTVSETRIASYIAIARGQVPAKHYFGTWRTFPDGCDWSWQESRPIGVTRNYLGVDVFEGAYSYRGMRIVPGWGGSMFESLMPAMFVPEERWAPKSWGINHPLTVRAQREHGLEEAEYGFWGFSPASQPGGGYREYGVDALGLNHEGYFSDAEKTDYDAGYDGCQRPGINPTPTYGDGVVTPHALFLAMHMEPREAYDNLVKLKRTFGVYGDGGFYDAVAVKSGTVAKRYLSLDQSMIMGSIGNVFGDNVIRDAFATGEIRRRIKPLIGMEQFGAGLT